MLWQTHWQTMANTIWDFSCLSGFTNPRSGWCWISEHQTPQSKVQSVQSQREVQRMPWQQSIAQLAIVHIHLIVLLVQNGSVHRHWHRTLPFVVRPRQAEKYVLYNSVECNQMRSSWMVWAYVQVWGTPKWYILQWTRSCATPLHQPFQVLASIWTFFCASSTPSFPSRSYLQNWREIDFQRARW